MYKYIVLLFVCVVLLYPTQSSAECESDHLDSEHLEQLSHGYCDMYGYFYPEPISYASAQLQMPDFAVGFVTWYNPNLMENTAKEKGIDLSKYKDGIALMSCADFGQVVWLKRPNSDWEGPYIVVDCANPLHMFAAICYKEEIAEVGYKTALEWGLVTEENGVRKILQYVVTDVWIAKSVDPPNPQGEPEPYRNWWLSQLRFQSGARFSDMNFIC